MALNPSLLNFAQAAMTAPTSAPVPPTPAPGAPTQFSGALAAALNAQAQLSSAPSASEAQALARKALQLGSPAPSAATGDGDAVLNGLQQLRGVFDKQLASFASSTVNVSSTEGLFKAQIASAQFSMFMDVSSKLAGKSSQAFQTLLKGQ